MTILHVPVTFANIAEWVRRAGQAINQLITGKQDQSDNLASIAGLDLTGHAGDGLVVTVGEDGFELAAGGGGSGVTDELLTFNNGGSGAASGATFDGSVPVTISYNSVGAAASGHNHTGVYQPADTTLDAFAAYNTNGLIAQTAADTFAGRTLTAPAAGITVSNGNGVSGNPTLALADDLAALEALSGTNTIYYRSGANTWTAVTISPDLLFSGGTLGRNKGTSFPGSPSSGDRFTRTDRNIEYFYDGTRWLSVQLFVHTVAAQNAVNPLTANSFWRATNPWAGVYDMYVERFSVFIILSTATASNYFTFQLAYGDGASADTNVGGSISSQSITINSNTALSNTPNAVVPSTADVMGVNITETGTASANVALSFTYRLVG